MNVNKIAMIQFYAFFSFFMHSSLGSIFSQSSILYDFVGWGYLTFVNFSPPSKK